MKRFFNKALLFLSLCVLGSCFQAIESPCPAADNTKTKKNHTQSLTKQDKSALDWVTGSGKPASPGNAAPNKASGLPPTHTPGTSPPNDLSNKHVPAKAPVSPPPAKTAPVGEAAGIGDLESMIKTIKQQQATIDLKAVGDSIIILRRKITNNPEDPVLRQRLGTLLYLAGDYEGAASELKHAISLKPTNYVAHALLGRVLADAGEREASSMEFHTAIALAPTVAATHCLYGESLVSRGDVSEGINEFRRSIGIKPNAMALTGLAEALMIAQDVDGSLKAARQAVSEESNSPDAYVALTKALLLSGDTEGAARTAREALLLNPNSAASHIAVGRSLYATGKP
ncbi:MAG: hypothetical protein C5B53_07370, partial [Candidatus Melainabacteria bacterium]